MSLPNIHFQDTPIEFKEINPNDFDFKFYNVPKKKIIEPNDDGYIGEKLEPILIEDFENSNTTIINAGVGQGKSRTIIKMVNKYVSDGRFIVIIAVPYKNLIEQYVKDCEENIPENEIFNILELDEKTKEKKKKADSNFIFGAVNDEDFVKGKSIEKLHIVTVNALLGNPGDDAFMQASDKQKHFYKLQDSCKKHNKKLVLIFDEVHDSIHNFKDDLIYKLWNYQGLIHKSFIISATFNEASKEVIKYLSEFTKKNIFIIESERKIIPEKQSELHIRFFNGSQIEKDLGLIRLVSNLLKEDKPFDILSYSKELVKKFLKKPTKKDLEDDSISIEMKDLLYFHESKINRCYDDKFEFKEKDKINKKYKSDKINIGTNFSTGVNILKENHTYILILPKDVNIDFFNNKGVFTNGSNIIIQALARQRKKGDIYVFMPLPAKIIEKSLPYSESQNKIITGFFKDNIPSDKFVSYTALNEQKNQLDEMYDKLLSKVKIAKKNIEKESRIGLNKLEFPPKEKFILEKGEHFLNKLFELVI